jgi:hypothetical protein
VNPVVIASVAVADEVPDVRWREKAKQHLRGNVLFGMSTMKM